MPQRSVSRWIESDACRFVPTNNTRLPPAAKIEEIREPIIEASILVPQDHVGAVIKLCIEKRGVQKKMLYLGNQVSLVYDLPMADVVLDYCAATYMAMMPATCLSIMDGLARDTDLHRYAIARGGAGTF